MTKGKLFYGTLNKDPIEANFWCFIVIFVDFWHILGLKFFSLKIFTKIMIEVAESKIRILKQW